MSSLPQRKKSAEEIAKLRESLGVPTAPAATPPVETAATPEPSPFQIAAPAPAATTAPAAAHPVHHTAAFADLLPESPFAAPKIAPVGIPGLPQKLIHAHFEPVVAEPAVVKLPPAKPQKSVRSLRKSEQGPITPPASPVRDDSPLPSRRRSPEEIADMLKRQHLALLNPTPPNPKLTPAHPAAIIAGYLCAIGGASCFVFDDIPLAATAGCAAAAIVFALLILILRPLSRHHSGFIAAITLMVIAFGTLHYFPHLQHAT